MKKKIFCFLSSLIIVFSFIFPFSSSASTLPPFICELTSEHVSSLVSSTSNYPFGYILFFRSSTNSYSLAVLTTTIEYKDTSYALLNYDSESLYFNLSSQPHVSSAMASLTTGTLKSVNGVSSVVFSSTTHNFCQVIAPFKALFGTSPYKISSIGVSSATDYLQMPGLFEVVASTVDLKVDDASGNRVTVYQGSESAFTSMFAEGSAPYIYPKSVPVEPPVPEPTSASTPDSNSSAQLEVSNSILDNIKTVVTGIVNLPSRIADGISSFFTSLGDTILGGFTFLRDSFSNIIDTLKSGILSGLEYLFKPSDNLFSSLKSEFDSRFGFVHQIKLLIDDLLLIKVSSTVPKFSFTIFGVTVDAVDFSWYGSYRTLVHGIILAFAWIPFLIRLYRRIPAIIAMYKD